MHDVCNCVIHGHSIWPKLFVFLWEEQRLTSQRYLCSHVLSLGKSQGTPSFADSNGHTNYTRFMPGLRTFRQSPTHPTSGLGSWVEECICLVCPASSICCLPIASRRRVGPLLKVQPIQQYIFKAVNHTLEPYPRIIPPDYGQARTHPHI